MAKTRDFSKVIDQELANDKELAALVERERVSALIARTIYQARTDEGLTQTELGDLVGTTQSGIARLEDADYGRGTVTMLYRIAKALNRRLEITMVKAGARKQAHVVVVGRRAFRATSQTRKTGTKKAAPAQYGTSRPMVHNRYEFPATIGPATVIRGEFTAV